MKKGNLTKKQIKDAVKSVVSNRDMVNHPPHYTNSDAKCSKCNHQIECIDITCHMGFELGNAVKYIWRYADKNGLEDLRKSAWYLNNFINRLEKEKN